jgi:hypothetical protein
MGIKVWIMKGEVYGKRSFSTCWNGQETSWRKRWRFSWKSTLIKVENQTLVKESNFKLKKMLQPKRKNTERYKGKMRELWKRA